MSDWILEKAEGVLLRLIVQPNASKTEVVGEYGEPPRLKIRLAAPPVDGSANEELISFLSKKLKINKSDIFIKFGRAGRRKDVFCQKIVVGEAVKLLCS